MCWDSTPHFGMRLSKPQLLCWKVWTAVSGGNRFMPMVLNTHVLSALSRLFQSRINHSSAPNDFKPSSPSAGTDPHTVSLGPGCEQSLILILEELRAALGLIKSQQASTDFTGLPER